MADPAALEGRIAIIKDNGLDPHEVINVVVADSVAQVEALGPAHCPAGHYLEDVNALPVSPGWKKQGDEFYREWTEDVEGTPVVKRESLVVDEEDNYVFSEESGFALTSVQDI